MTEKRVNLLRRAWELVGQPLSPKVEVPTAIDAPKEELEAMRVRNLRLAGHSMHRWGISGGSAIAVGALDATGLVSENMGNIAYAVLVYSVINLFDFMAIKYREARLNSIMDVPDLSAPFISTAIKPDSEIE